MELLRSGSQAPGGTETRLVSVARALPVGGIVLVVPWQMVASEGE